MNKLVLLSFLIIYTSTVFSNEEELLAEDTMYSVLKDQYMNKENTLPTFEDFQRIGDEEQNCIEVTKDNPDTEIFVGIYLYTKTYAARGPLFPAKTIQKVIVNPDGQIDQVFEDIEVIERPYFIESIYTKSSNYEIKTRLKKRNNQVFFRTDYVRNRTTNTRYGYCYPY